MYKICIFAGTTEGRHLTEYLSGKPADITVCVATEYGETLIGDFTDNIKIHTGRLDRSTMTAFFAENAFDIIIDATHPYAETVTANICESCGVTEYIRLNRSVSNLSSGRYFSTMAEAADYLDSTEGNILLTTGSKELSAFRAIPDYKSRIYARVLPLYSSIETCKLLGYEPSHIIAMQGPFSYELNLALIKSLDIKVLVTKDSGDNGGFTEKIKAAETAGCECVIIGRPLQTDGLLYDEIIVLLNKRLHIKRKLYIIGAGVGDKALLTAEAETAIRHCDVIIGAKRITDSCNITGKAIYNQFLPENIRSIIDSHSEYRTIAVVMSGDIGFYSGAKKLYDALYDCEIIPICGISSPVYLCAKLHLPWEDIKLCSLHGCESNIIHAVRTNFRVFTLIGGENNVHTLCNKLCEYGYSDVKLYVGMRLSYTDEKIIAGTAEELAEGEYDKLSSVLIENNDYKNVFKYGIEDERFIRSDIIPMTKSEIRAVSLSKLQLGKDSVVYDIGAGTGSVSVECALMAYDGDVYAVEKKTEAAVLIEKNKRGFAVPNLHIIKGNAPEVLADLPVPTHAFIGGSSGNLHVIIDTLLEKNPAVRIVINAITLETITEAFSLVCKFDYNDIVQIAVSKAKKLASYNLMTAQNPVYIFTYQKEILN